VDALDLEKGLVRVTVLSMMGKEYVPVELELDQVESID
jgi:hypothetical protein